MLHNNTNTNNTNANNTNTNNTNTNNNVNESMPGSMPQENNNNTQFEQQGQEGLNHQTKPSIIGGPHKIQSGILNHGFSAEHDNVNNNNTLGQDHGEHNYKTDAGLAAGSAAAAGLAGHEFKNHHNNNSDNNIHDPLHNTNEATNPLNTQDGHRTLLSHHKGLGTANATQSGPGNNEHHYGRDTAVAGGAAVAAGVAGHELKDRHKKKENESVANNSGDEHATAGADGEKKKKPLNTSGAASHIAEQKALYLGGLTGQQPVGEVNFKKL